MQPVYISIHPEETGKKIKNLIRQKGYTVRDVQQAMGFENPQAVYKWLSGRSLPSIDNLLVLSVILHTRIEEILVYDGDFVVFKRQNLKKHGFLNCWFNDGSFFLC